MKLVDILARELKSWPHDVFAITQDDGGELNGNPIDDPAIMRGTAWGGGAFYLDDPVDDGGVCFRLKLAEDWSTAIVTYPQWQAAVDALKTREQVMNIDWSIAPEWADCVIRSADDELKTLYWAEPWGTKDGKRCELGAEYRRNDWINIADTASKSHRWVLVAARPLQVSDLIAKGWLESPSLYVQQIGRVERKLPEWSGDGLPPAGMVCEWKHAASETWHQAKVNYIGCAYVIFANHAGDDEQHYYLRDISFRQIRPPEEIIDAERESAIKAFMKIGDIYYCDAEKLYDAGARLPGEGKKV